MLTEEEKEINKNKKRNRVLENISIGSFLAYRQVKRSSWATTVLIIFVMTLTFLNLVVVSGILVGLIQGATDAVKKSYISDISVTTLKSKNEIENSPQILKTIQELPWVDSVTARYLTGGVIEANYKTKIKQTDTTDEVSTIISGIDPASEQAVTNLSSFLIEGEYLKADDTDKVIIGSMLLKKYFPVETAGFSTLSDAKVGDKVRITIGVNTREMIIKGIVKTKVDEISRRVFMPESQFRILAGKNDFNVNEMAIKIKPGISPELVRDAIKMTGADKYGKIQTFDEAKPKFLTDLINTFALLGNVVGSIGLVVASITIFIVIYINAITRRKFIGILKGIGIESSAIKTAYVRQAIFYAFIGTALGCLILFALLKPYFDANPIDFPFSDGILSVTISGVLVRVGLLMIATIIAGYIPAQIVVRQNTLDAILGR
ncbi:MAG: FtsX-like permease family protein [Candidatus Paceibacterota bacterium]|jgi:ABC-type lipoprotein release transport system permease subunit